MKSDRTTLQVRITHPERLRFERSAQSVDLSISEWARLVLRRDCDLWTGETKKMNAFTTIMTAPDSFCKVSLRTTLEGAERAACDEIAAYAEDRGMDAEIVKAARAGDYQDARRRLYGVIAGSIEIVSLPVHE
jgi:hypothetical protein